MKALLHLLPLYLLLVRTLALVPPANGPVPAAANKPPAGRPTPHQKNLVPPAIPGRPTPNPNNPHLMPNAPRAVWLISDQMPAPWTFIGGSYGNSPQMNSHYSVHVGGNAENGPMRITMKNSSGVIAVDATDWGVNNAAQPIGLAPTAQRIRDVVEMGKWIGNNKDLMDPEKGLGLVAKAWAENRVYEAGFSGCGRLAVAVLGLMKIKIPPHMVQRLQGGNEFMKMIGAKSARVQNVQIRYNQLLEWGKSTVQRNAWGLKGASGSEAPTRPPPLELEHLPAAKSPSVDVSAEVEDEFWVVPTQEDRPVPIALPFQESEAAAKNFKPAAVTDLAKAASGGSVFMLARASGVRSLISVTTAQAVKGLQGAAVALGPVFVILDFLHGDWVGGALAAVGTALATAESVVEMTVADLGPVGWLADIVITALFFILPGLIESLKKKDYPPNNDAQKIIQYAMFGKPDHTGNEKCKQGNPACQVVYGPSVIANVFKWELFDAIAFMIQFNHGLTMTIPDMAASFKSIDPWAGTANSGAVPQIATITCTNRGGKNCEEPAFRLDRTMITLPNIGQTADKVYGRIINAQGQGDCKIVAASMSGMNFPDYNYTLLNTPVSIACGISTVNVDANALPYGSLPGGNGATLSNINPAPQSASGNNFNPASQSTDGNGGEAQTAFTGTVAPFQPLLSSTNGLCLTGSKGDICLPNGTYTPQTGKMGYNSQYTTGMTLPPSGGKLIVNAMVQTHSWKRSADPEPIMRMMAQDSIEEMLGLFGRTPDDPVGEMMGPQMHAFEFDQSVTSENRDFTRAFSALQDQQSGNINVLTPTAVVPPGACLFTQTNFNGDAQCLSAGAGPLPQNLAKTSQSISVKGGATVFVYSGSFNDKTQQKLPGDTPNLNDIPDGVNSGYSNQVVAMWIDAPTT
ncbi:hypothetical protein MMC13_003757 [Lambiella insularis]|nr:hypothetical protein [Lambiella insularis]